MQSVSLGMLRSIILVTQLGLVDMEKAATVKDWPTPSCMRYLVVFRIY